MFYENESSRLRGAQELVSKARSHVAAEDLEEAIWCLRKAVEVEPQHVVAWRTLGDVLRRSGDNAGAKEAYESALKLNPGDTAAWSRLSHIQEEEGDTSGKIYSEKQAETHEEKHRRGYVLSAIVSAIFLTTSFFVFQLANDQSLKDAAMVGSLPATAGKVIEYRGSLMRRRAPSVEFQYWVAGKGYKTKQFLVNEGPLGFERQHTYQTGQTVKVRYTPENPAIAYVDGEKLSSNPKSDVASALLIFGVFLLGLSAWGLWGRSAKSVKT